MSSAGGSLASIVDDPWLTWLLESARERVGTDVAYVADFTDQDQRIRRVVGDGDVLGIAAGTTVPLEGTFCVRVLSGLLPPVVTAAGRHPATRDLGATAELGIGSYVGAPIRGSDGRALGMLCCLGRSDGAGLDAESARFVEFLAELVGQRLDGVADRAGAAPDLGDVSALALRTVFQPIVDIASGRPVGYEALSRFDGADPEAVFAGAALAGRHLEIERRAMESALAACSGGDVGAPIGINLSPDALLVPDVRALLLEPRAQRIGVEITEHRAVSDYAALVAVREELRAAGVPVSVDDAGAGYASLRHVLQLKPDGIKLDAALVSGIDADPDRQALVAALLGFADEIGAVVVAEGIETAAECRTLADRGVRLGQGWLWGRPGPLPTGDADAA